MKRTDQAPEGGESLARTLRPDLRDVVPEWHRPDALISNQTAVADTAKD